MEAEGGDLQQALRALREKDIVVAGEGGALAGEPELAFKHALIRDAAYEMLPKAVRAQKHFEVGSFIEARAGERVDEVVALLAEHYGRAAQLGSELRLAPAELEPYRAKALHFLEAAGDAATAFYSNAEAFTQLSRPRCEQAGGDAEALARLLEKQGDVALRLGRVDAAIGGVGAGARAPPRPRASSSAWPSCTARSAPRWRTRASASRRSSTTSAAST